MFSDNSVYGAGGNSPMASDFHSQQDLREGASDSYSVKKRKLMQGAGKRVVKSAMEIPAEIPQHFQMSAFFFITKCLADFRGGLRMTS